MLCQPVFFISRWCALGVVGLGVACMMPLGSCRNRLEIRDNQWNVYCIPSALMMLRCLNLRVQSGWSTVSRFKTFRFACGKQTQRKGVIIQKNVNHGRGGELSSKQSLQGLWRVLDLPLPAAPRVQLECKPSAAIHMGVARPIKVLDDGAAVVNVKTWRQS